MGKYLHIRSSEFVRSQPVDDDKEPQSRPNRIHWRVPAVMVSSFVAGVVLAVGHHATYTHFNKARVDSEIEQKWVIRIGTAFAFLFKTSLAVATGTAYIQQLWLSVKRKPKTVDHVDTLFSVLGNATLFWNLKLWSRNLVLAVLALVTWCLPLAAIVTPGTIIVQPFTNQISLLTQPAQPQQSWNGTQNYAIIDQDQSLIWMGADNVSMCSYGAWGPSNELMRISLASATQQSIVPILPPQPDSSYSVQFFGPALNCSIPSADDVAKFNASWYNHTYSSIPVSGAELPIYNAWVPWHNASGVVYDWANPDWSIHETTPTTAVVMAGVNNKVNASTLSIHIQSLTSDHKLDKRVLLDCALYNATYSVQFHYEGLLQGVTIKSVDLHQPIPATQVRRFDDYCDQADWSNLANNAPMWALNQILVGDAISSGSLDYEGFIGYETTKAGTTALEPYIEGKKNITTATIKAVVEELFQNITISTLSSSQFRLPQNMTPLVNTTIRETFNVYVYHPANLFIAYGVSVACALGCVAIGCFALVQNKLSYSNNFSTIFRTTRRQDLAQVIMPLDRTGGDPLPRHISKTRIKLTSGSDDEGSGFALMEALGDTLEMAATVPLQQDEDSVSHASAQAEHNRPNAPSYTPL